MMYHNHVDPVRDRKRLCSFHSVQANRALPFAFICQGKRVAKAKAFDVVPYFVSHFFVGNVCCTFPSRSINTCQIIPNSVPSLSAFHALQQSHAVQPLVQIFFDISAFQTCQQGIVCHPQERQLMDCHGTSWKQQGIWLPALNTYCFMMFHAHFDSNVSAYLSLWN